MLKRLLLLLSLFPVTCFAQFTVSGRILNQSDTKPVPDASVFLSNATIGDKTAQDGRFTLQNIKPGKYELVISLMGYDIEKRNITVDNSNIVLPDITIFKKTIALNQVTVKAERNDPDKRRNFELFRDEFLGTSALAKQCKIINPEFLDISYNGNTGILTASSVDFLIIDNNALGYKLKYLLSDFTLNNLDPDDKSFSFAGSVLFEQMKGTPAQQEAWRAARQQVYEGSPMHFLRSVINNRIDQEGFRVLRLSYNTERPADSIINEKIRVFNLVKNDDRKYKDSLAFWVKKLKMPKYLPAILPYVLTRDEILKATGQKGLYSLDCSNDALYISYNKYRNFSNDPVNRLNQPDNRSTTMLMFNTPLTFFDNNGAIINPRSLTYDGVWIRNRLAGLLPVDFEPMEAKAVSENNAMVRDLNAKIKTYVTNHSAEKVYLHLDKPYYTAKDTVYFKAYITEGENHAPSRVSGVVYADLVAPNSSVYRSVTMQVKDGVAWGDIALPDTLKPGNYHIKAYTQWMKNDGEASFFDKVIPVGNASTKVPKSSTNAFTPLNAKPAIEFFPESGLLVNGIRSKIAFKAINPDGLGTSVKGVITDNDDKEVATFESAHLGMGFFYLEPKEKKTYKAKLTFANGQQDVAELPEIIKEGITMDIANLTRSFNIKVSCSRQFYQDNKGKEFSLVVLSAGVPSNFSVELDRQEIKLEVLKSEMRTGIAKATLFNPGGEPMCERLLFVQNDDQLKLTVSTVKKEYGKREKTDIKLQAASGEGSVTGHFSVAVVDESRVKSNEADETTIMTNLLLTSDLRGYVEQPNYYFTDVSDKTAAQLDLVMLTHGYRRFEWRKILNDDDPTVRFLPQSGLQISGRVTNNDGKPAAGAKVNLFSRSNGGMMLDTIADANGRFVFDRLDFTDTTRFVVKARTATGGSNVKIELDKPAAERLSSLHNMGPQKAVSSADLDAYAQTSASYFDEKAKFGFNRVNMLGTVNIAARKDVKQELKRSQNLNGAGAADQVIREKDLDQLKGFINLYQALRAKAFGLQFINGTIISRRTGTNKMDGGVNDRDPMLIVVDGTTLEDDPTFLSNIQVADVASVEIGLGAVYGAAYGPKGRGGVVIVTTKPGRRNNLYTYEAPGVVTYKANGFYKAREFYSPKYDNPKTNQQIADYRSTIYWRPEVITDAKGNASLSFFNADGEGTYKVTIEGLDSQGNLARQVYRYIVK